MPVSERDVVSVVPEEVRCPDGHRRHRCCLRAEPVMDQPLSTGNISLLRTSLSICFTCVMCMHACVCILATVTLFSRGQILTPRNIFVLLFNKLETLFMNFTPVNKLMFGMLFHLCVLCSNLSSCLFLAMAFMNI